jgi:MazG family protein
MSDDAPDAGPPNDRDRVEHDAAGPASTLRDLVALVARLRAPDGCPWDREQRLGDLRAYLVEEAHEAAAAIDGGEWEEIASELGDLLFQVAFVLHLGEEAGATSVESAVAAIHAKMVARHPHVFGDERAADADEVRRNWERRKAEAAGDASILAGVPASLPALVGAYRISQKAAGVGFDWPDVASVLDKVREELLEVEHELGGRTLTPSSAPPSALEEELGDLLFAVANLARHAGVDPERALAAANRKFRDRFASVERGVAARGGKLGEASLDELEALWQAAKQEPSG